jgi:molecular chaperone GrpE
MSADGDAERVEDETAAAGDPLGDEGIGATLEAGAGEDESTPGANDEDLELSLVRAERDEYLDALRRLQAEFENFRKRTERHQVELSARATERLIEALLPVVDAFDLALSHASEVGTDPELTSAFAKIGTLLTTTLEREGLERIDAAGASFDPTVHDAVATEHADGEGGGGVIVAEVLRAGYRLHGRVLRPAMVKVKG